MSQWKDPDTCPEGVEVLCYYEYLDGIERIGLNRFRWIERIKEEIESQTTNAKGRRKVVQETTVKERQWERAYAPTHWMERPDDPPPRC